MSFALSNLYVSTVAQHKIRYLYKLGLFFASKSIKSKFANFNHFRLSRPPNRKFEKSREIRQNQVQRSTSQRIAIVDISRSKLEICFPSAGFGLFPHDYINVKIVSFKYDNEAYPRTSWLSKRYFGIERRHFRAYKGLMIYVSPIY